MLTHSFKSHSPHLERALECWIPVLCFLELLFKAFRNLEFMSDSNILQFCKTDKTNTKKSTQNNLRHNPLVTIIMDFVLLHSCTIQLNKANSIIFSSSIPPNRYRNLFVSEVSWYIQPRGRFLLRPLQNKQSYDITAYFHLQQKIMWAAFIQLDINLDK